MNSLDHYPDKSQRLLFRQISANCCDYFPNKWQQTATTTVQTNSTKWPRLLSRKPVANGCDCYPNKQFQTLRLPSRQTAIAGCPNTSKQLQLVSRQTEPNGHDYCPDKCSKQPRFRFRLNDLRRLAGGAAQQPEDDTITIVIGCFVILHFSPPLAS